jgi:hypothetical protein
MSVADINFRGKGASPGEWDAVIAAGLLEQMLPVVQNPGLPRSPASALKTVGKVPSQLNAYGEVVGVPQWTKHVTTAEEVAKWRRNLDIGISIRLGAHMAAIDCDVDDKAVAEGILAIARRYFGDAAPIRVRADSARWLMPIRTVDFTTAKRRYTLRCGDVPEILGDGCQFVACGTHPRGCRYRWIGNIKDMPSVTSETFEAFIREMVDTYGTGEELICRGSSRAPAGDDADVIFDRLYHWIKKNLPFDERRPGELDIPCPWEHEHSSGKTLDGSTTYYCAGTHGYAAPAFVCLHSHCSGRGLPDFEAWAATKGYERTTAADFEGIEAYLEKEEHTDGTLKTQEEKDHYTECMYKICRFKDEKSGKIAANLSTVVAALQAGRDYCGVDVRHDTFRNTEVYREKASEDWQPLTDARAIVTRKFLLENRGFGSIPRDLMRDAVLAAGYENSFDSMKDYLDRTLPEWDGVDRITNFFARYCASADTPLQWAIARYMWAALYGRATSTEGIKADIVIVLVGRQGARKSTLVRALAPRDDLAGEISLETRDADLARQVRGKVIIEIPELVGMSKKDVAAVKYWISLDRDAYIPKYQERETVSPRRCIFIMTTNDRSFLSDTTGNRRYGVVEVGQINIEAVRRDSLQLWAQARVLFEKEGIDHRSVEQLSAEENKKYMYSDPWDEAVASWLESREREPEAARQPLTAGNILSFAIGASTARVSPADGRRLAAVMGRLGYALRFARLNGKFTRIYQKKATPEEDVPF